MVKRFSILCFFLAQATVWADGVEAPATEKKLDPAFEEIRITERLGSRVDIDQLQFTDETGQSVQLSKYFQTKKPVIMMLVYYKCPGLCNYLLNGFVNSASMLEWTPGKEFEVVNVSVNPEEGPDLAVGKKETYVKRWGRDVNAGWHWLTGREDQIKLLAKQLGFGYRFDPESGEFAHSAGIFVLTPQGVISRTLYGIDFPYRDLKLSLLEASDGKLGSMMDQVLMFCYRYDPFSKGYALYGMRLMQLGGLVTLMFLAGYLFMFWSRERKKLSPRGEMS
jgi:protein SCO1/2